MLGPSDPLLAVGDSLVVRAADGTLLLTDRAGTGGIGLRTDEAVVDRRPGATAVAGLLVAGAERVEVVDDRGDVHAATVGHGAWLAVLPDVGFSEHLVRYLDGAGAIVARPFPPGERRRLDADESCPVCDAAAWEEVADADARVAVCGRCAFVVAGPRVVGRIELAFEVGDNGGDADPEPDLDDEWERELAEELAGLTMPVYALAGEPAEINGWGGSEDEVRSVTVEHDRGPGRRFAYVDTARLRVSEPPDLLAALAGLLAPDEPPPDGPPAAVMVVLRARERAARRRAAKARHESRELVIDGQPAAFAFVTAEDAWVAVRDHHGVRVTITASGLDPDAVAIGRLVDPTDASRGTTPEPSPAVASARRAEAGELLDRDGVRELLRRHGLEPHEASILAAVAPGYRLAAGGDGRTRIGGLPDLAPGEAWPHSPSGIPYTFVAQVDCGALPALEGNFATAPPWGHGGAFVRIFADLYARIPDPGRAVALACPRDAPTTRAELPPAPDPMPPDAWEPDDDSMRLLPEEPVRAVPMLTAPVGWNVLGRPEWDDPVNDRYRDFVEELIGGRRGLQLLGHAEDVQGGDPRSGGRFVHESLRADADWRVLLALPDAGFWDAGAIHVVAPVEDLAAGRYDRLVVVPSMG